MLTMRVNKVVTVFLEHEGTILILKRSQSVRTMKGKWAGISGYIEGEEEPFQRALKEIQEETGLAQKDFFFVRAGAPVKAEEQGSDILWLVHPFLFGSKSSQIRLDREHEDYRWIRPQELGEFDTVPSLKEALAAVWMG
jgi:8-oxo-dGTP diphosphatase